jgi:hypothetical protein
MSNPFVTHFGLLYRLTQIVEMIHHDERPCTAYTFWAANTVNNAYGNPTSSGVGGTGPSELFTVLAGRQYQSPSLKQRGLFFAQTFQRQTQVRYNIEDFVTPGGVIPEDDAWHYLRVQEHRSDAPLVLNSDPAKPLLGSIYCIPPASFFGHPMPFVMLSAVAPSNTSDSAGALPSLSVDISSDAPRAMHLIFPLPFIQQGLIITNVESTGGNNLLVSPTSRSAFVELGPGEEIVLGGGRSLVFACADPGGAAFRIVGNAWAP